MFWKIYQSKFFKNYLLYCLCYVYVGMTFVAIGPLLPYYSSEENRNISDYSVLVITRSIGYICGSLSIKLTQNYIGFHKSLMLGLAVCGIFSFAFDLTDNMIARSIFIFLASYGVAYIDIYSNISTIQSFSGLNYEGPLQFLHGCAGIGGLIIPLLVLVFQTKTYLFLGIVSISIIPIVLFLDSPQVEIPGGQRLITEQSIITEQKSESIDPTVDEKQPIPFLPFAVICFSFFLSLGIEAGYGNWVSSYAVIRDFATKENAALYSSVFWLSITTFRFVFAFLPGSPSKKLKIISFMGGIFTISASFIIFAVNPNSILITASALIGMCDAAIFALLQSFPVQFGFQPKEDQTSTFMLFAGVGQGSTAGIVGFLLGVATPEIIFYIAGGIFFTILVNTFIAQHIMMKQMKEFTLPQAQVQIEKVERKTMETN